MAIRFPSQPTTLEGNRCYQYMLKTIDRDESWSCDELIRNSSPDELRRVLQFGVGVQKIDRIVPSYTVVGTTSKIIMDLVAKEVFVFGELLHKLPKACRCDAARLKDLLSYLVNCNQVQLFNLPASGLTVITVDSPERDEDLDWIFSLSDMIEV